MTKLLTGMSANAALVFACVIVGCATGAVISGAIGSADYLAIIAGTGFAGGTVATAHVVGSQVNTAAGASPTVAPQPVPAAPVAVQPANPQPVPTQPIQGVPAA